MTESLTPLEAHVLYCYKHPKSETRLRCTECDRPICLKCSVVCEVGNKCRECVDGHKSHLTEVSTKHYVILIVGGMLLGYAYWSLTQKMGITSGIFWLLYLLPLALGNFAGRLIRQFVRYKLGPGFRWLAPGSAALGMLVGQAPLWLAYHTLWPMLDGVYLLWTGIFLVSLYSTFYNRTN
jgi:hypothetical protein